MRAFPSTAVIVCTQSQSQSLPFPAARVEGGGFLNSGAASGSPTLATNLSPIATTGPASTQIGFTGSPHAVSSTVWLSATATAGELLLVRFVPQGGLGAAA